MPYRIKLTLVILVLTLLFLAIIPLLIPVPELEGTVPARNLAMPDDRFVSVDGLGLRTRVAGQGPPNLVLLHDFGGSVFSWRNVLEPLAARGRVVAFDRPAFGLSDRPLPGSWPKGENPYTPQAQVRFTLGLMDQLGMDRAVLVGSSSGAVIALQLALQHPERVRALVLIAPALQAGGPPGWVRPLLDTPQFDRMGPLMMRQFAGETGKEFIRNAWADPDAVTDEIIAGDQAWLKVEDWDKALWELTKASRRPDFQGRLGSLHLPVLLVTGAADPVVPPEATEHLAAIIPGSQLAELDACGHLPQEECPKAFLAAVTGFLEKLPE